MKGYLNHIKLFAKRFALLLLIFTITRILFFLFNKDYLNVKSFIELIKLHIAGIRFDISALFYFNILFILLSIIPGNFKNRVGYQKFVKAVFVIVNFLLIVFNLVDVKFYEFEYKRMTSDIFTKEWLGDDFFTLLPQFLKDFWYIPLFIVLGLYLLIKIYPSYKENEKYLESNYISTFLMKLASFIIVFGICFLGGRGGFQLKPLRVNHAAQYTSAQNIPLVTNTPFTIMKTIGGKNLPKKEYFAKESLDKIYNPVRNYPDTVLQKKNVVLIILESFSKEYIGGYNNGVGYTPFIDTLMKKSMYFPYCFANGKRSMESMPSIIASIPHLLEKAYITSPFATNQINSLASVLNKYDYRTTFFHGGKNGTMGFDQFAKIAGFDQYYGQDEYGSIEGNDGNWGIYDEEYFLYFADELSAFEEPFLGCIYTLTSHHPYEIPEKYNGKFPKGKLKIHESIGYTDYALKKFFEKAENTSWYENTVFVITADHTAQAENEYYANKAGMYAIPLIVFDPSNDSLVGKNDLITQQIDIFPSVIDYLGIEDDIVAFGNSAFDESDNHFAVNYINGIYQLIYKEYNLLFDGSKTIGHYNLFEDSLMTTNLNSSPVKSEMENRLKGIIQSFEARVDGNRLVVR